MAIQNNPLFNNVLLANPQLATLIDGAATQLTKKSGGGTATATATATATGGGVTATATANAGGQGVGATANQAGKAIGQTLGQFAGDALKRAPDGALGQFAIGLVEGLADGLSKAFAPSEPAASDNCPSTDPATGVPSQLAVDSSSGEITTAGGYKIQATNQFEWTVTGPDGSKTKVWGDPHVETSGKTGGEKFDFKKDTTFVLPDGTKINVKTTPWTGNKNVTVTQSLEIIQGNDRVEITDIDKGKGKVGQLGHGAQANETYDTEQTFVAGKNVADWFFSGHEIKGNANGTPDKWSLDMQNNGFNDISNDAFKVGGYVGGNHNGAGKGKTFYGDDLHNFKATVAAAQGAQGQDRINQALQQVLAILPALTNLLNALRNSFNAYNPPAQTNQPAQTQQPTTQPKPTTTPPYNPQQHEQGLRDAFGAIGAMLQILGQVLQLMSSLKSTRQPMGTN